MHKRNSYLSVKGQRRDTKKIYAPYYAIKPNIDEGKTIIAMSSNILIQLPAAIPGRKYKILDRAIGVYGTSIVEVIPEYGDRVSNHTPVLKEVGGSIASPVNRNDIVLECNERGVWNCTNAIGEWDSEYRVFTYKVNEVFSGHYGNDPGGTFYNPVAAHAIHGHGDPALLVDIYVRNDRFAAGITAANITPADDLAGLTVSGLQRITPHHIRFLLGGDGEAIEVSDGFGDILIAAAGMTGGEVIAEEIRIPVAGITDSTSSLDTTDDEDSPIFKIDVVNDVWHPLMNDVAMWDKIELTGDYATGLTITDIALEADIITVKTEGKVAKDTGTGGIKIRHSCFTGAILNNHTAMELEGTVT